MSQSVCIESFPMANWKRSGEKDFSQCNFALFSTFKARTSIYFKEITNKKQTLINIIENISNIPSENIPSEKHVTPWQFQASKPQKAEKSPNMETWYHILPGENLIFQLPEE